MKNQTTNAVSTPAKTTTIEVKTFESGRFSLKLNGKKVALKTFSFDNGFYSFPADTEIIFNGRKLRYIGTFREFFDTEYLFADENGNGVRNDECASLIWGLAKFGTHDVNRQIAQVANDKKAYFVRAKIESEQHAIDAERTFCRGKIKMIDSNVFNLLPDFADEDDDDELIDEPTAEIEQTTGTVAEIKIETKISANGTANVYVNGKRTSREAAVKFAEENNLPTYTAICYPYSERNYSISEEFATALSAYKWIVSKANSNRNVADGSFEIRRYTDGIKNETTIFDYTENGDEKINADDEPEFATFIYAEIGEVHISERYDRMVLFHNQLANDGLTEEQINQVLVTQYNNENGREHCKLIKEFKAQNGIVEVKPSMINRSEEPDTTAEISEEPEITKAEKITAVIADAKDFIATNLDAHTEKVFKLCFGINASIHFYLNNLKGKLFSELRAIEDEMSKFKGTAMKFYDAYLAASDGYLDSEEMTALYYHICDCVTGGYSTSAYDKTRNIAKEILDKLGEETLMREIAKVTDEFGISRDLLNQSDSCEFKPFNLDTAHDTPAEISEEPEITKAEKITDELAAALKDIYIADTFATPDENDNVPIIPAVDFFAFAALLYLTDICTTAYRKNPDGTFTEDEEAYKRLHEVEMKFFDEMPDTPDTAPDTPGESICKVAEHLNANAPEGWAVIRDKEKLRVEYQGKFVAAAERVTDRDLIVPQAFFRQFEPLIDKSKTPAQIFLDDRYRELAELEKMRKSPDCTPAAIKTLDEMINRLKRDIADAELSPADTIESYCKAGAVDEHGVIWF